MSHYVIGDVHGHADALRTLLEKVGLDPRRDRLWLVGDLVNRGPDSPGVLRLTRSLAERMAERFVAVLGNHDVHLLALVEGLAELRARDTVQDVLEAPDRDELLAWLRALPLLHREARGPAGGGNAEDLVLVHAGLRPEWTLDEAERRARRVEAKLRDPEARRLLLPRETPEEVAGERAPNAETDWEALRRDFQVFVHLRTLTRAGEECDFSGPPDEAPDGCIPWFRMPERRSSGAKIFSGHWAALGLHRENGVTALDSGCAWSGCLTALRLDDGEVVQQGCSAER